MEERVELRTPRIVIEDLPDEEENDVVGYGDTLLPKYKNNYGTKKPLQGMPVLDPFPKPIDPLADYSAVAGVRG